MIRRFHLPFARGIAHDGCSRENIAGDNAPRADHRVVAYGHARKNDRTSSEPHIATNRDRFTKLQSGSTFHRIARVIGRVDMDTRTNLRSRADVDSTNVENHAIEVEKYIFAKVDIVAIVTMEGRPDHGSLADGC